jgi:hypothetical protein
MHHKFSALSKYTAHSTTIIFLVGFILDIIILPDITDPKARYFGLAYLLAIAFLIMFREWLVARNTASKLEQNMYSLSTFGIVCLLGSALSFVFIYAVRSGALSVSWPLFLILALCIVINELVSTHNFRFTLDIGVLFVGTLFYTIFNLPGILKVQNDITFGISIAIAMGISLLYVYLLRFMSDTANVEAPRGYALAVGIPMFVGMLYFLNVLPAVPLSSTNAGVYHAVVRTVRGEFIGQGEVDDRRFSKFRTPIYHLTPKDSGVYFFNAVNAPAELSAPLSHVWEYYDTEKNRWVTSTIIPFTLAGGREDGYRAYSKKENISEGLWRVTTKVGNKRIIGRTKFKVERSETVQLTEQKL